MEIKKFIVPSWRMIDKILCKLAQMIKMDSFTSDIILGVSNGGLIPATVLLDRLGVDCDAIGVQHYKGVWNIQKTIRHVQNVSFNLNAKRVLIVDAVADAGLSLQTVKNTFKKEA